MNRINKLFQEKPSGILSIYFCAGHPTHVCPSAIIGSKFVSLLEATGEAEEAISRLYEALEK